MKTIFLFTVISLAALYGHAQDTIVKRNGDIMTVKLLEINPYDIRYRLPNYPDGPVFTVFKEELKELRYANGYKESLEAYMPPARIADKEKDRSVIMSGRYFFYKDRRIREPDMLGIVLKPDDKRLNLMARRVEEIRLSQNVTGIAAIPLIISGAYIYERNLPRRNRRGGFANAANSAQARKNGTILMLCGLGSGVISFCLMLDRRRNDRILVNAYNATIIKR